MPTVELLVSGILFDSDGTLIDSTPSISKVLVEWCQQQSIDPKVLAADGSIHGIRTKDILRKYQKVPKLGSEMTEEELESEAKKSEALVIEEAKAKREQGEKGGIEALPGVVSLVERFSSLGWKNWGIVTSATRGYVTWALSLAGIENVPFIVSGDQTKNGKPHPEPYGTGLFELHKQIGCHSPKLDRSSILVIEDSPAGIISGLQAGCQVLAVGTGPVKEAKILTLAAKLPRDIFVVKELTDIEVIGIEGDKLKLRFNALQFEKAGPVDDSRN